MNPDFQIRQAAFQWLNAKAKNSNPILLGAELQRGFEYQGQVIHLKGARGIWKPKSMDLPISISSTIGSIYNDGEFENGILTYRYEGSDPNLFSNRWLRKCHELQIPLIYFSELIKGRHMAIWPVFIVADDPANLCCQIQADTAWDASSVQVADSSLESLRRTYETREVQVRLHQRAFREKVIHAYRCKCSICSLKHESLLDAAHITPDSAERGEPIVSNGLALCKIHHAAFDRNILGISPDYQVHIRQDILEEEDGPMLKHGIQEMQGRKLILPRSFSEKPDKERLAVRFEGFKQAM